MGDQLDIQHSWFSRPDPGILYIIAELRRETDYVRHHIQKLCAFFAAMEAFAEALRRVGHEVLHLTLDDTARYRDLEGLAARLCREHGAGAFEYQRPDEFRLLEQVRSIDPGPGVTVREHGTEHFLLPWEEIPEHFRPGKARRMEAFYRGMRRRFGILMDGGKPLGGRWNYDRDNRRPMKAGDIARVPKPLLFENDVLPILKRLDRHGVPHFGVRADLLPFPVDRDQALGLLEHFLDHCLQHFGRFQDAIVCSGEHRWSLYHSRLSFAMNARMMRPMEVIKAALARFEGSGGAVSLPQVEGFVRQILGWREFVRGVYWANMPEYQEQNVLEAYRPLPGYFWDGRSGMACMKEAIGQSLEHAYAHHILRLMITGNFCLIAGIDPAEVDAWYLGVYADAVQWVQLPNTRGMSQFADGGLVASKPYAAGGNYISRMSDCCSGCRYDVRDQTSEKGCPFNSLYWDFMARHRKLLGKNPRSGLVYGSWDRRPEGDRRAVLKRARWCLENLDIL